MTELSVEERVDNGICWLNWTEERWRETVKKDELNISSDCNCVMGLLYGSFFYVAGNEKYITFNQAELCGFDNLPNRPWGELQAEWIKRLSEYEL